MRNLLVLGSGRSGTSMVAGTLSASGWWVGDEPYAGRAANPKGFFETAEINGVNEELLARVLPADARFEHGQRWLCTLAPDSRPELDANARARIERLVAHTPFAFKDPRLCYTLPAWEPLLPQGTGRVCVFRDPAATLASIVKECREAAYLASLALDEERALAVWTCMYERVLAQAGRGDWLFVHYDQMLTQDGLARLENFAGAPLDRRFPEASLRRTREHAPLGGRAAELYRELCARAGVHERARVRVAVPAPAPELSVILCTYQRREILERSIASFEAQDAAPGSFELVVVDDGCSDGTTEWLDAHAFTLPARVLHKHNGGLASARNVGIAAARGRILLFVNDDTLAYPDLVREHLRAHAELAAGGLEASVLGTFEQPTKHLASALMRHLEGSGEVFRYHDMRAGEFYDHNRFWTCNVSVSAARVREAGAFDERFKRYGCEDIDLGLRLERLGLRVCYHPGARAQHEHLLDFESLRRRQLSCSASFVHLFAKHPSELDHPDWCWLAGRTSESMGAELSARSERLAQLESAVATLARVEFPPLEALGETELVQQTLERLRALLAELNPLWWQAGLVQGLGELGCDSVDELRAREPETAFGGLRGDFTLEHARTQLALVRAEAAAGENALATLRAIGMCAALAQRVPLEHGLQLEALSDLAVLRHGAGDREGARALLAHALTLAPEHELARAHLEASEAAPAPAAPIERSQDLVEEARKSANLLRARVLWLGDEVPEERLRALGVRSLFTVGSGIDVAALAQAEASFDVILGALPRSQAELDELARVLRPGGRWVLARDGLSQAAELPAHALRLLDEGELRWYLEHVCAPARAGALLERVRAADRRGATQCKRALCEAGFDIAGLRSVTPSLSAALRRELQRALPGESEFASERLEGLLLRRGRTLVIGELAASAAGA